MNLFLVPSSFCWRPAFLGLWLHHADLRFCCHVPFSSIFKPPSALQRHSRWHSGPTQVMQQHLPHLTAKPRSSYTVTFPGSRDSDGGHYSANHKVSPERSQELGGELTGKAFRAEGIGCAQLGRQESFEARSEEARGEWREGAHVKSGILQGPVGRDEDRLSPGARQEPQETSEQHVQRPSALSQILTGSLWPHVGRDCRGQR